MPEVGLKALNRRYGTCRDTAGKMEDGGGGRGTGYVVRAKHVRARMPQRLFRVHPFDIRYERRAGDPPWYIRTSKVRLIDGILRAGAHEGVMFAQVRGCARVLSCALYGAYCMGSRRQRDSKSRERENDILSFSTELNPFREQRLFVVGNYEK